LVRKLEAYVPGEQPKVRNLVKLNTNENPYPPSPRVFKVLKEAMDGRLRLYPNPKAQALREALARFHGCGPENVIVGNGSDDLLAMATRAFVQPVSGARSGSKNTVQFFSPSYSLYPVLAAIHGAQPRAVSLRKDFGLPTVAGLRKGRTWDFQAALSFVTTPNAPSGRGYTRRELGLLCRAHQGVLVLDEAYAEFAREQALELAMQHPHVLVSRTFSKAYSLCFLRAGYGVGHPELITALDKVRDSYNVNGMAQLAAEAALGDRRYYEAVFRRIVATRERVARALRGMGFQVLSSQTNFLLVKPPRFEAVVWLEKLREHGILVRWFGSREVREYLRVTIGTAAEMNRLLKVARFINKQ
jgi:histidinol-phosphate aminotransferase